MNRTGFLAALLVLQAGAGAEEPASRAEELARVEATLKERSAEEKRLRNEAFEREKEVAALRYRMIETANALQNSERRLGEIGRELDRLLAEEEALAGVLGARQSELSQVLGALQSLELSRPPALFISPGDANQAARAAILLSDAAPKLADKARALRRDLELLRTVRKTLDDERAAFEKTSAEIDARRDVLAALLRKKQSERDVAQKLAAAAQKETAALASRATTLREVVRRLRRLARAITPRLKPERAPGAAPPPPNLADRRPDAFTPARAFAKARGALKPPVVGRLVASFGSALPGGGKLEGVRFAARDEAVVTAPYEASVVFARQWDPVGNLIVLDVGGGYHILLMGVKIFLVQEGQKVAAGEPVAAMAAEKGSEVANLDLEIRRNGEPVDPALWLSRRSVEEMAF